MPIKREEVATERELGDIKRIPWRRIREKKLDKLSRVTLYFCFLAYSLFLKKAIYVS